MSHADVTFSVHLQELRRGTIVLGCLRLLDRPDYGYRLLEQLQQHGLAVDGNTLYPLLRRLEKQGFLTSEWQAADPRPRKFYRTSEAGEELAEALEADWRRLTAAVDSLTEES
ncbi:PadR family transcriptional regulator [Nesterenkonia sp. F]|uniref:PadR family transcriptional regulator n=1 Tax=Nesterenkonia sp. F TaxID=795955 RepID=UPI000255C8C4|nr:helix-turn-helix transcriptional regulator [Nesterenkonia sp. F]